MSLISPLLWEGIPYGHPEGMFDFFGQHDLWHRALARRVPSVPIVPLDNLPEMLDVHDEIHRALNQALRLSPPQDFSLYDLHQRQGWILFSQSHSIEHARLRAATGI